MKTKRWCRGQGVYVLVLIVLCCVLVLPSFAYAQDPLGVGKVPSEGLYQQDLREILPKAINWLLSIAAVVALLAIVWGGLQYITSLGDESKAKTAKSVIFYAVLGLLIIGISFAIINLVKTFVST